MILKFRAAHPVAHALETAFCKLDCRGAALLPRSIFWRSRGYLSAVPAVAATVLCELAGRAKHQNAERFFAIGLVCESFCSVLTLAAQPIFRQKPAYLLEQGYVRNIDRF
jgi:hypothetical protein